MARANDLALEEKQRRKEEALEEEKRFLKEFEAMVQAEMEAEKEGQRRRRERNIVSGLIFRVQVKFSQRVPLYAQEHIKEIENQTRIRAQLWEQQMEISKQEEEAAKEKEEFRRRVVEEARKRLLAEHAAALKDRMPRVRFFFFFCLPLASVEV